MKCTFQCQHDLKPLLQTHWTVDQFVSVIFGGCHSDDQKSNPYLKLDWWQWALPIFPPLVSQHILCLFLSNRKWPHNSKRKSHKCRVLFSKNTRHNNILEKRAIVNFEEPVARIRFVLLNYFWTLETGYRNQCLVRALDKTVLEILGGAGTVHFWICINCCENREFQQFCAAKRRRVTQFWQSSVKLNPHVIHRSDSSAARWPFASFNKDFSRRLEIFLRIVFMKPVSRRLASNPVCAPDKEENVRLNSFCFCKIYQSFEMGKDELLTRR